MSGYHHYVKEIIEPDEKWVDAYNKLYPYYVSMYQHLDSDLKNIRALIDNMKNI